MKPTRFVALEPHHHFRQREILIMVMRRAPILLLVALLTLGGVIPLLSACHTVAGAGEDIAATGHVITHTARRAAP